MTQIPSEIEDQNSQSALSVKSVEERAQDIVVPDGGYGWIVVFASFFVHVFVLGNIYSFGVFFPTYTGYFHANNAAVSWIGSIGTCMMNAAAAYAGSWSDQFGNQIMIFGGGTLIGLGYLLASYSTQLWHLYLTQGFISGIGYSFAYIAGVSVVGQWFSKLRGLAVGVAVAGSGLGQFAVNLVTASLIQRYGWRSTLRYLALINLVGLLLCSLVIRRLLPCIEKSERQSSMHYFKDRNFAILYGSCFCLSLGYFMPFTFLPRYALLHNISYSNAVWLLSAVGISSSVGRVLVGFAADEFGSVLALRVSVFGGGVSVLCWSACSSFNSLLSFSIFYGFFAGGVISLIPSVTGALFGIARLSSVIGLLFTAMAVGNLLSAPIGGFLIDAYGTYVPAISFSGAVLVLSAALLLFVSEPISASANSSTKADESPMVEEGLSRTDKQYAPVGSIDYAALALGGEGHDGDAVQGGSVLASEILSKKIEKKI